MMYLSIKWFHCLKDYQDVYSLKSLVVLLVVCRARIESLSLCVNLESIVTKSKVYHLLHIATIHL